MMIKTRPANKKPRIGKENFR